VRELEHVIERAVLLCDGPELVIGPLSPTCDATRAEAPGSARAPAQDATWMASAERQRILRALEQTRFRISGPHGAALLLGVHPNTLRYRMAKLGIAPSRRS
jgi:transcriptional regulator with GAF, ATPase, and Fis domain